MTATADFIKTHANNATAIMTQSHGAPRIGGGFDGGTTIFRTALRLFGASFVIAAFAMWVAPGAMWQTDLLLMKLAVSVVCALIGLALIQMAPAPEKSEIQFDPIRREVRIVDGISDNPVLRRSYDSLGGAKVSNNVVTLWDADGSELASFPISDDVTRRALSRQLDTLCA